MACSLSNPSKIGVVEEDNALRIYSADTGKVKFLLQGVWAERTDGYANQDYNYLSVASSADGNLVAIGAPRRKIRILTLDQARPVFEVGTDGLNAYAFSSDGKRLLSGTDYPQHLQIWDVANGKELFAVDSTTHQGGGAFSPDGKRVAIWGAKARSSGSPV
jgi:WD40 repeat protein